MFYTFVTLIDTYSTKDEKGLRAIAAAVRQWDMDHANATLKEREHIMVL